MAGKKDLERLRRRKRRKQNIIRATVHFFVWAGVAVLYYVGFSLFFDTPVEYELKHSTDRLRREYAALTQRYDSLTTVMHNLSEAPIEITLPEGTNMPLVFATYAETVVSADGKIVLPARGTAILAAAK